MGLKFDRINCLAARKRHHRKTHQRLYPAFSGDAEQRDCGETGNLQRPDKQLLIEIYFFKFLSVH